MKKGKKYRLYLASGITLWKDNFRIKYSEFFNRRLELFEPGLIDLPEDHRFIPIKVATFDLDRINQSDALLVYMKHYKTLDGSPEGTDSTWECGYAIAHGKPVIMLIEDKKHIDYYASQWMVSFSINAVITLDKEVAKTIKNHPKFVHVTTILAQNPEQFETKIIEYLDNYYRSIYSRVGLINYFVDARAAELFSRRNLRNLIHVDPNVNSLISNKIKQINSLKFESDKDSLLVSKIEREISEYLRDNMSERMIDSMISSALELWNSPTEHVLDCLEHSIKAPFLKNTDRKKGVSKTRPELFFELYNLVTHHLIVENRFVKSDTYPYEVGAIIELYNWMNTYALDDVFDNSEDRQKFETVWKKFSRRDAIYTGLLGHILALKYLFLITPNKTIAGKLAKILNEYNYMMYTGQVFDMALTIDDERKRRFLKKAKPDKLLELYVKRVYGICGGFYEAIAEMAVKAENKEEQIMNGPEIDDISALVGMYYGIIQMIRNDLGDYILPKDMPKLSKGMKSLSHSDVEEGKVNIPYIIALSSNKLKSNEKSFLLTALNRKLSIEEKIGINELLWKSGAIDLTVELIIKFIDHVKIDFLSKYHETPTRMKWMFNLVEITKEILIPFKKQAFDNLCF
jgi:geranylgeranyl pyrophosphate synthase/nucleoside 2-deoxyribosyltransferase